MDVPYLRGRYVLRAMVSSFDPSPSRWRQRVREDLSRLPGTAKLFQARARFCQGLLDKEKGRFDAIFQISGMFAPTSNYSDLKIPFVTLNDYTRKLAAKYPGWTYPPSEMDKWIELEKELYKNARYIFAVSENTRNSFINDYGIQAEKVIKVSYGSTLKTAPSSAKEYDTKSVLFVGKDFARKGGPVLLKSFEKVRQAIPDATLTIVGPDEEFLKIRQAGIEVLGNVNEDALKAAYARASVFVLPSICEPFGLVLLEAMESKLPCIGTTVDAMPEIIQDGKTGFLVAPGDVDSLADRMIALLGNSDLSEKMGNEGYQQVRERFTWDALGEKVDFYLRKCVN
jgi:alpha-maltose-1-phosphate synthase